MEGFEMTGLTGSGRYMAPEVVLCQDYGLKADVYSFGIMFWEVASLSQPFRRYTSNRHFTDIILKGRRPLMRSVAWLSPKLRLLIQSCWKAESALRPPFSEIRSCLHIETKRQDTICNQTQSNDLVVLKPV